MQQARWIRRQSLPNLEVSQALAGLHPGEREAIALASSLRPRIPIILDDRRARRLAQDVGLVVIGSGGILGLAKRAGLITSIQPTLFDLMSAGLFLSEAVVRELLEVAGERQLGE